VLVLEEEEGEVGGPSASPSSVVEEDANEFANA